jgi:DNA-binding XRE family transcriptional regulator
MAKFLEISQPSYCQLERGTKQPSIPILEILTKLFCCTADELMFGGEGG